MKCIKTDDAFALSYCHMSQKFRGAEAFRLLFRYVIVAAARNVEAVAVRF